MKNEKKNLVEVGHVVTILNNSMRYIPNLIKINLVV